MKRAKTIERAPEWCAGSETGGASEDLVLPLDAFVRSVGVRRASPLAFFLGAGASTTSGVPSAQSCIWEWKRQIFLTNNPGLEEQFAELSLDGVRRKTQRWLDSRGGFPGENAGAEYGFFINACFPISDDRRAFFAEQVRDSTTISHPPSPRSALQGLAAGTASSNDFTGPLLGALTPLTAEMSAMGQVRACRGRAGDGASPSDSCRNRCSSEDFRVVPITVVVVQIDHRRVQTSS